MYAGWRKARAIALATGVAAVLTASATITPAGAAPAPKTADAVQTGRQSKATWITLITGDRVAVDGKGKVLGVQRAKGRENEVISTRKIDGHTYVIPQDAARLIATGKVDRRLFDVTTQSRAEYRKAQSHGLGYIVSYKGSTPTAKAELHAASGTEVTHTYTKLNTEAVTAEKQDTASVWAALTNPPTGDSPYATAESGLKTVWLDAVQKASAVDWSRSQIGAPTAWDAGYTGAGVKIAILDTGIYTSHADLNGTKVVAQKNFSDASSTTDKFGHGTHVASIAAGTGAKNSAYKGVAPGAQLLNGKVLNDSGYGQDSWILAGLQWAAQSGAKIANLSLGGTDMPGTDVLESAVNTLSDEYGTLFVIAAGNEGDAAGTVGSPGSADAALTVGAVDKNSALAGFSSRGPRVGDAAIKPDLTAPGVDITAAAAPGSVIDQQVGENPAGYLTISGTSMATPHVAGAAAILAQEHPTWTGQQIKAALVSSTTDNGFGYTVFEQGTGQVDLTKAIDQTVTADSSLSFATAQWPHQDDTAETKTLKYTNTGDTDVTLDLALSGKNPNGGDLPAGFFTLSAGTVTVPAATDSSTPGTASVNVTADPTKGSVIGAYSAYITGTSAAGQTVRTAAGITREEESYTLTLKHLDRTGAAAATYDTWVMGQNGDVMDEAYEADGTVELRLPKGTYGLDSLIYSATGSTLNSADIIVEPVIDLTADKTLTLDARNTKPVSVTVPDSAAKQTSGTLVYDTNNGTGAYGGWTLPSFKNVRTLYSGAELSSSAFLANVSSTWKTATKEFNTSADRTKSFFTGYSHKTTSSELAKITTKVGSVKSGTYGILLTYNDWGIGGPATLTTSTLGFTRSVYVTAKTSTWGQTFAQTSKNLATINSIYFVDPKTYTAGKTYTRSFNTGVFGPVVNTNNGIYRLGNDLFAYFGLFSDGQGHDGTYSYDSATTSLYRNGTRLKTYNGSVDEVAFTVPATKSSYKLTTTVSRSSYAAVSSKIVSTWTFSSTETDFAKLSASTVRFSPSLSVTNSSKASTSATTPVTVQGSAAGKNLKSLSVYYSFDGGKKWTKVTVKSGKITVKNPKAGKYVSLKANATAKNGSTVSEQLINAYVTK